MNIPPHVAYLPALLLSALLAVAPAGCDSSSSGDDASTSGSDAADSGTADLGRGSGSTVDDGGGTTDPGDRGGVTDEPVDDSVVTYHRDLRPIMEAQCATCHQEGEAAPFALGYDAADWTTGTPWWGELVVATVDYGIMPPWLPAEDCRDIRHTRRLTDAERQIFSDWRAGGFVEGDPEDYVAPEDVAWTMLDDEPDLRLTLAEPYVADKSQPDDYRCFVIDAEFDEDVFVRASHVFPGQRELVHHVILYLIPPDRVPDLEELVAADTTDAPGYACFGGSGVSGAQTFAGWVPGAVPFSASDTAARAIPAGSKLVMQMHYNTSWMAEDDVVPGDQTEIALWTAPTEGLTDLIRILPFANLALDIPAGDPSSQFVREFDLSFSATVIGATPHMHTLGRSISAEIVHADGSTSCLVDIPEWDFNWQQFYVFEEEARVDVVPGDKLRLTCEYDNSAENQPTVNGEQLEPRDVAWGDGTFDEMCLNYLTVLTPFDSYGATCYGFEACQTTCADGDLFCFFYCGFAAGTKCLGCLGPAFVGCGYSTCPEPTGEAIACLQSCPEDTSVCIEQNCKEPFEALYACVEPSMEDGACNEDLAECDVTY